MGFLPQPNLRATIINKGVKFHVLEFEWDENKRESNLKKHGIDFVLACKIFYNYTVEFEDNRYDYEEERFNRLGKNF